jgi:hypothetical protein
VLDYESSVFDDLWLPTVVGVLRLVEQKQSRSWRPTTRTGNEFWSCKCQLQNQENLPRFSGEFISCTATLFVTAMAAKAPDLFKVFSSKLTYPGKDKSLDTAPLTVVKRGGLAHRETVSLSVGHVL